MANLTITLALENARRGIRINGIRRLPPALVVGMIGVAGLPGGRRHGPICRAP